MALVLKDRVKETSTTAGTGTLTLAGAAVGFQSFSAIGNGNTTYYAIADSTTGAWEVGIGTYTSSGTTLSRTTVLSSSNGGSLVSFAANSKDVFCTYPSAKSVYLDSAGVVVQQTFGAITATSAALTTGTITTSPTNDTDIVNKLYADSIATGINFHAACNYATTADLGTVTYNNGASGVGATLTKITTFATLSIDGANPTVGQRILVKNQTSGAQNGVYTVTSVGSGSVGWVMTRATDYDTSGSGTNEVDQGDFLLIISGTANANTSWVQQTALPITIGTTSITFIQFGASTAYTAGTGLTLSTYQFSLTAPVTVSLGGTGLTSLTAGYIPFGAGTSAFGNSSNLFWDSANDRLGLGTSSPNYRLVVSGSEQVIGGGSDTIPALATTLVSGEVNGSLNNSTDYGFLRLSSGGRGGSIGTKSAIDLQGYGGTDNSQIRLYTAGTERFRFGSAGQFGIGGATYGTSGQVLTSGGSAAAPTWGAVSLTSQVSGTLPVANGGTGTTTPSIVAGSNITVTGTWPNQTIASSGGSSGAGNAYAWFMV